MRDIVELAADPSAVEIIELAVVHGLLPAGNEEQAVCPVITRKIVS